MQKEERDISWEEFEKTLKKRKLAVYKAENSDFLKIMKDRQDSNILYKQIRGHGTRLCSGKGSFLMLDFANNSPQCEMGLSCMKRMFLTARSAISETH